MVFRVFPICLYVILSFRNYAVTLFSKQNLATSTYSKCIHQPRVLVTAKALVIKRDKERSGLRHEPFLSWWYPLTINLEKRNGPEFILSWSKSGSNSNRIRRTGTWNNTAIILLLQYLGEEKFPIIYFWAAMDCGGQATPSTCTWWPT